MNNITSFNGPPFSLVGNSVFLGQEVTFSFVFSNPTDENSVLSYEWYLDRAKVIDNNQNSFSGILPGGSYIIGGRLLTSSGWSGIKERSFTTNALPVSEEIVGSGIIREGETQSYRVMGTFIDGSILDLSQQYVFSSSEGYFNGNQLTIPANGVINDARTITITASRAGASSLQRSVSVIDSTPITIDKFDYMAVRYQWLNGAGSDMDVLVGFENNNTIYDKNYVGYGQQTTIPTNTPGPDAFLWWGLDTVSSSGYEGVLIGIKKFIEAVPNLPDIIEIGLYAVWYGAPITGNFTLELVTYLGGTMELNDQNFVNSGGVQVSSNVISLSTLVHSTSHSPATSYKCGVLKYNKNTQTATIEVS